MAAVGSRGRCRCWLVCGWVITECSVLCWVLKVLVLLRVACVGVACVRVIDGSRMRAPLLLVGVPPGRAGDPSDNCHGVFCDSRSRRALRIWSVEAGERWRMERGREMGFVHQV